MNPLLTHEHFQVKTNIPALKAGDRIRVHQKIKEGAKERVQVFEGIVLKTQHGSGINGTFTVRRITLGVGVEKTFPIHLPTIVKIEKVRSAKVRQAKIFYIRDLIGKRANRLKKEKEDKEIWEDVVVEQVEKDPEQVEIEESAKEAELGHNTQDQESNQEKKEQRAAEVAEDKAEKEKAEAVAEAKEEKTA